MARRSFFLLAFVLSCLSCNQKVQLYSAFYQAFDVDGLRAQSAAQFTAVRRNGAAQNILTQSPDGYLKHFVLSGPIPDESLERAVRELEAQLRERGRRSGAELSREPSISVLTRPSAILDFLMENRKEAHDLFGFHFTYREGRFTGSLDALAGSLTQDGERRWTLSCALIEESP